MKTKILFSYHENVIPPKCRKPRLVRFDDGEFTIEISEVSASDAPVAIRAKGAFIHRPDKSYTLEYRWWNGRLWSAKNIDGVEPRGRTSRQDDWDYPAWPSELDLRSENGWQDDYTYSLYNRSHDGREQIHQYLADVAQHHLVIDGVPYRPVGEPRYVVMTFGLGQNHGGTACMMDSFYNSNISKDRYFSLLQRDQAIALATQIATQRGDTKSLPIDPHGPEWEICIPAAIQVNPATQHGDGCAFLNSLEAVAQISGGSPIAAFAAIAAGLAGSRQ